MLCRSRSYSDFCFGREGFMTGKAKDAAIANATINAMVSRSMDGNSHDAKRTMGTKTNAPRVRAVTRIGMR